MFETETLVFFIYNVEVGLECWLGRLHCGLPPLGGSYLLYLHENY